MSEKFKLAFGSDSEFFEHNANFQRLRVTKTPVDVAEDIYFSELSMAETMKSDFLLCRACAEII